MQGKVYDTSDVVQVSISQVIPLLLHVCLVALSVTISIRNVASRCLCSTTKFVSTAMQTLSAAFTTHAASTDHLTVWYPPTTMTGVLH